MIWSEWIWHEPKSIKTKQNTKDCLIFAVSTLIWRKVESNNRYKYDNNHTKAIIRANDTDSPCVAFLNFSVFVIAVNQIIYYIILYESALFNRAVSEERLDLNLHSTTVSEKNIKSQKPVAAGPISENTQLSPPLTQNETFAETTEMCDFRTKTTSSSLKAKWAWGVYWNRGGPKVIRLHALSQMKFVFSKKIHACTATSQSCLVGFARRLLHIAARCFFLFFSFAFWCREDLFVERRSTKEGDGSFPGDPQQHHHAAVSLWILWAVTQTSPRPSSLCYNSPEMFPLSSFYAKSSRSAATDWCEWQQNVGVRSPPNPLLLVSGLGPGRHGWRWISVWPVRLKMFSTPSPPR